MKSEVPEGRSRVSAVEDDLNEGSALSIADVIRMLRRHILFIMASVIVCTLVGLVYIHRAVPIYEATASIRIDPSRASSLGFADLASGASESFESSATEIAVLRSDAVAIDTLNSLSDQEFFEYAGQNKSSLGIKPGSTVLTPAQEGLLGKFRGSLSAKQAEGTQIVLVTFRDSNPRTAALFANRTITAYLRQTFDSRYASVAQVSQWLSTELDSLRQRSERAQRDLAAFQEKNDILVTDSGTSSPTSQMSNTITDRLRLLNGNLTAAEADRIVKEAQMRAAMTGSPAVLNAMFPSTELAGLQTEQGKLQGQIAELSSKFGPRYPPLAQLQADLAKISAQVDSSTATVRNRLKQQYDAAVVTEGMLRQQYDEQTQRAYAVNRSQADFAVLRAEVNATRELYNTLQVKLQQAGVNAGLSAVNTMLLDTARAPLFPVEPKKQVILGFAVLLGLFLGVGISFLLEASSDKVQSIEHLEQAIKVPLLAMIPHFKSVSVTGTGKQTTGATDVPPTLVTYNTPTSRDAEAFRSLRSSVLLSTLDVPLKTILVVSSLPGEGKSLTASNLSVALAQAGSRVLLIDADLRRPALPLAFGLPMDLPGLTNLLLGDTADPHLLQPLPELPNLTVLPAGRRVALPAEVLGSEKFKAKVKVWEGDFDYVVVDTAPLFVVSDSVPLSSWFDGVLLVVRYNVTPMKALHRVYRTLRMGQANILGLVLNDLPPSAAEHGYYGYGKAYYTSDE